MSRFVRKGIVFFAIFIILFQFITMLFVLKTYPASNNLNQWFSPYSLANKITGFQEMEKDTLDVVFVGSSHVHVNINPLIMYQTYGIKGYDFSADQQDFFTSYYYAKEVFERQNPQVLAIEVGYFCDEQTPLAGHFSFDFFPNTFNKISGIINREGQENIKEMLLPIYRYHTRWKELTNDDFAYFSANKEHKFMGHWAYLPVNPQIPQENQNIDWARELSEQEKKYVDDMYALCVENNCQLVLFKTPSAIENSWQTTNNAIKAYIAEKEYNIPFKDYSFENIGLDYACDFVDPVHLNIYGAEKFTMALGEYLIPYIQIEDKHSTNIENLYEKNYEYYIKLKENYEFAQSTNYNNYINSICENEDYVAFVVGRCDLSLPGIHFNEILDTENSQWSYCAIIENGAYVFEEFGHEKIQKEVVYGENHFVLTSDPGVPQASLLENNREEKAINSRGINIVVYDKELDELIDFKCFDVFTMN